MAIDQNDILAAWSEQNLAEQGKLIDLMVAATLIRYEQNYMAFRVDELRWVAQNYTIVRTVDEAGVWRIGVSPKLRRDEIASAPVDSA